MWYTNLQISPPLLLPQHNEPPTGRLFVVSAMSQLAHYVYQDYHLRVEALKAQAQQYAQQVQ